MAVTATRGAMATALDNRPGSELAPRLGNLLALALMAGVSMGLVEGAAMIAFRRLNLISWKLWIGPDSPELISVCVAVDAALMLVVAAVMAGVDSLLPRLRQYRWTVPVLFFIVFYGWSFMGGWVRHRAAVILGAGLSAVLCRWFDKRAENRFLWCRRRLPVSAAIAAGAVFGIPLVMSVTERVHTASLPAAGANAPNVIVLVMDTLRADHLSLHGYHRRTSPNLEALAHQGTSFSEAFAASSWTLPSHASLLTGQFPHAHGAEDGLRAVGSRFPTLPEFLRNRGYRTGAFSANSIFFTRHMGLGRGFLHFEDYFESAYGMFVQTVLGRELDNFILRRFRSQDIAGRLHAENINDHAIGWIDANRRRPFFAFLNYFDVHAPYLPPNPYRSQFSSIPNPGGLVNGAAGHDYPRLTPEQLQTEIDAYDGGVAYMDNQLGDLLRELDKRGLSENTLVIVTSDHGESLGDHGLLQHRNALYRELIRVPLVVRWPGHVPAGVTIDTPISNTSLPATILELTGSQGLPNVAAQSLVQLWSSPGAQQDWPLPLSELGRQEYDQVDTPATHGWLKSLSGPQWHYIIHQKFPAQLYDWRKDPAELSNYAGKPEAQAVVNVFASQIRKITEGGTSTQSSTLRSDSSAHRPQALGAAAPDKRD